MKNQYGEFRRWSTEEDNLVRRRYARESIEELCRLLPLRTDKAIRTRARKLGVSLRAGEKQRKYTVNASYFSSPTIESSYWAGYIAADGCLQDQNGRKMLTFCIKNDDRNHLKELKTVLGYTGKIEERTTSLLGYGSYEQAMLRINSPEILHDLMSVFGLGPRKSKTLKPPNLSELEHKKAFIIGYIDGDGCISTVFSNGAYHLKVGLVGTEELLLWVKEVFDFCYPALTNRISNVLPHEGCYRYAVQGRRAVKILNDLNAMKIYKMARKWNTVKNFRG